VHVSEQAAAYEYLVNLAKMEKKRREREWRRSVGGERGQTWAEFIRG